MFTSPNTQIRSDYYDMVAHTAMSSSDDDILVAFGLTPVPEGVGINEWSEPTSEEIALVRRIHKESFFV